MIRFLLRFIGLFFLAAGFIFLVYDGTRSIAASAVVVTPLGQTWNDIHSRSLDAVQAAIQGRLADWVWDPVFRSVLHAPTWFVFGILGAILILLGRKKKPLIGYARE